MLFFIFVMVSILSWNISAVGSDFGFKAPVFEENDWVKKQFWMKDWVDLQSILTEANADDPQIGIIDSGLDPNMAKLENVHVAFELNFVEGQPMIDDDSHGTGIALQLAARENGFGVVGLVPKTSLAIVRLGTHEELRGEGMIPFFRIERAFRELVENGTKVVNLSLSSEEWCKDEFSNLLKKYENDLLVVAAAGNDAYENLQYGKECSYVPICLEASNLLKVGGVDSNGLRLRRSNQGEVVELWAPGEHIEQWRHSLYWNEMVRFRLIPVTGSSHAAPFVAAAAAILARLNPGLEPVQMKEILLQTRKSNEELDVLGAVKQVLMDR